MDCRILFSAGAGDWPAYERPLTEALRAADVRATLTTDTSDPRRFDFVIWSPASPITDFTPFTGLKAVLSLWAGVERAVPNQTIRVPLCRMVDPDLTQGMTEYVAGHALRYHLGLDTHVLHQDGVWRHDLVPKLARDRPVGILGWGALGRACGAKLAGLGFPVTGWSRKGEHGSLTGEDGLRLVLGRSEILVLLLPLTDETENLLDAERLALVRSGSFLINPGRGRLIDDQALLAALDSGRIAHATLDVFRQEPLPPDHPFWAHPQITVTPHLASETRPSSAAATIAANLRRWQDGLPLQHVVDRGAGY